MITILPSYNCSVTRYMQNHREGFWRRGYVTPGRSPKWALLPMFPYGSDEVTKVCSRKEKHVKSKEYNLSIGQSIENLIGEG